MQEERYEIENHHGEYGKDHVVWQRLLSLTVIRNHKEVDVSLEDLLIGEQGEALFASPSDRQQILTIKRIK